MATLNSLDNSHINGSPVVDRSKFMGRPRTNNTLVTLENDTCFMCEGAVINGYCLCNVGNTPVEQPAYEPQLLRVSATEYLVDSFTHPGVTYPIQQNSVGVWMCGCPAYAFKYECKHIRLLLDTLGTPVATPAPVAPKPTYIPAPFSTQLDVSDEPLTRIFTGQPITKAMQKAERALEKRTA